MKKRVIALFLALAMVATLLAACGNNNNNVYIPPATSDGTNNGNNNNNGKPQEDFDGVLKVGIPQSASISDFKENDFTKWVEEQLGFELEFVYYSANGSEACQQFALDCAAENYDEMPDVVWGFQEMSNYTLGDLGEDGYILDLTPYLTEEYFPNYFEALADIPENDKKAAMEKGVNPDDGGYYGMPLIALEHVDNLGNMMFINQDWLDNLNLDMPTTVDELYTVLRAFKDSDPNGNGRADEIPMLGSSSNGGGLTQYLMNAYIYWDAANIYNVTDYGVVYSPIVQDAYREGLKYINKLYEEGLIGEMSYSGASYTDFVNMNTPHDQVAKVGIWMGHPSVYTDANTTILDQYAALPYLQDAGTGLGGNTVYRETTIKYCSWILAHVGGEPEETAAMRFLDLMYTDEAMTRMRYGEKGIYWDYGEEGLNIKGEPTTIHIYDDSALYGGDSTWGRNGNCIMTDANYTGVAGLQYAGTRAYEIERLTTELWENVYLDGNLPAEKTENLIYNSEEFEIREDLHSRYWSYYSEAITRFITGRNDINDDAAWNAYKTELESLGRHQLEAVVQSAYNRK